MEIKNLIINGEVTVTLGKKNKVEIELSGNLKDHEKLELLKMNGTDQRIEFSDPQMSIEQYLNKSKGTAYTVNGDGTVDGKQLDIGDVDKLEDQDSKEEADGKEGEIEQEEHKELDEEKEDGEKPLTFDTDEDPNW